MNEEEVKVEEEVKKVISVTADSGTLEGSVRQTSTGKANTRTSPSLLSSDEKTLPRYLRASTKSCHDFCKYGKSHVFEAKKRQPICLSFPQSSSVRDEDQKATEVSTLGERMKRSELKVKAASRTKVGLSDKIEGVKKIRLKEKESFEVSQSWKRQTPLLANEAEESSEGFKTSTPLPVDQIEELSDASGTTKIENCLPTEKRIISHEPTTPHTWSEGSSDRAESMEPDSPSSIHTPEDQFGKLTEEPLVEIMTPPGIDSMERADEPIKSKPTTLSSMPESLRTESAERLSERVSNMELKAPTPNHKSSTTGEKRTVSKNLKVVEGKKTELAKPEVSDRAKAIIKKKTESTPQPRIINKRSPSPGEKLIIVEQKSVPTAKKVIMSVSPKITKNKAPSSHESIDTPRPSISLKLRTTGMRSTAALISSRKVSAQKDMGSKVIRSADLSKLRTSPSPKHPVGREEVKNQVKVGTSECTNEKVKEKILHVIERRTPKTDPKPANKEPRKNKPHSLSHSRPSSSLSSSSSSSMSTLNESRRSQLKTASKPKNKEPKKDKSYYSSHYRSASSLSSSSSSSTPSKRSKAVCSPKCEKTRRPIRTTTTHSEPKLPSPPKLKFQRCKMVSPKSDNNAPRKLKLWQAKGVSETQNNKEAVRRSFVRRRRVSIGSRAELTSPGVKAPPVVLKHQEVKEKKEIQGLLNHVIEETASKLVETRKSKVKALVGAFETVISLQETRVATPTF